MKQVRAHQDLQTLIASEAKKTKFYKDLTKRNFRQHSGYPDYKSIAIDMAATLMTADTGIPMRGMDGEDPAYVAMLISSWLAWHNPTFPVYAIAPDLARAFMNTETPSQVCAMKQMFNHALFLVPDGLVRNPDGKYCNWLFVTHLFPGDFLKYQDGYEKFVWKTIGASIPVTPGIRLSEHKLQWATTLGRVYVYGNVMLLPSDSDKPVMGELIINTAFGSADQKEELHFTQAIDKLILQTMLYMQLPQKKQILMPTDRATAPHKTRGFDPHSPQEPIWIGAEYRQQTIKKLPQGGTHASPDTHWRSGHWRFIPVGRGSVETKPVWVRPTIVNG